MLLVWWSVSYVNVYWYTRFVDSTPGNGSAKLLSNYFLRLASNGILLPDNLLISICSYKILWNRSYLYYFRKIWSNYWSFLHSTIITSSFSLSILRNTSILVIFSVYAILNILLYNYSSNASYLFEVVLVRVHVSI